MVSEVIINQIENRAVPYLSVHDAEHALEFYAKHSEQKRSPNESRGKERLAMQSLKSKEHG
jgi:uncharacterized glyoxalase superfamily protein PhnB